jgi:cell wall-associated NlpC family hydrolase
MSYGNLLFSGVLLAFSVAGCSTLPAPGDAPDPPSVAAQPPVPQAARPGDDMLFHALAALGVDYRYGGTSRQTGFDCSGLVAHVYREAFGIELPHHTLAQSRYGKRVPGNDLQLGDLVFYNTLRQPYSHVGIYLGDGRFIHAPRTGAAVRVERMASAYWSKRFDGARRILD